MLTLNMIKKPMEKKSFVFIAILFLTVLFTIPSYPFDIEFPLVQSFSYFPYVKNSILKNGNYDLFIDIGYSNIYMFNYKKDVVNDFEFVNTAIGYRKSISPGINIEFYSRIAILYGGIMDKLIVNFHKLIGNGEDGRGEFPLNTVNYKYKDVFSYNSTMVFAGPLIAGILTKIYDGDKFDINFRVSLGIPLQNKAGISTGKPFVSTGLIFLHRSKNFLTDISLYASFFKRPDWLTSQDVRSRMYYINLHMGWKKIFGGFIFRSTPFIGGDLSNPAYQIYLGYKISNHLSISMHEEIPPMDTISDVTFKILFEF